MLLNISYKPRKKMSGMYVLQHISLICPTISEEDKEVRSLVKAANNS